MSDCCFLNFTAYLTSLDAGRDRSFPCGPAAPALGHLHRDPTLEVSMAPSSCGNLSTDSPQVAIWPHTCWSIWRGILKYLQKNVYLLQRYTKQYLITIHNNKIQRYPQKSKTYVWLVVSTLPKQNMFWESHIPSRAKHTQCDSITNIENSTAHVMSSVVPSIIIYNALCPLYPILCVWSPHVSWLGLYVSWLNPHCSR